MVMFSKVGIRYKPKPKEITYVSLIGINASFMPRSPPSVRDCVVGQRG